MYNKIKYALLCVLSIGSIVFIACPTEEGPNSSDPGVDYQAAANAAADALKTALIGPIDHSDGKLKFVLAGVTVTTAFSDAGLDIKEIKVANKTSANNGSTGIYFTTPTKTYLTLPTEVFVLPFGPEAFDPNGGSVSVVLRGRANDKVTYSDPAKDKTLDIPAASMSVAAGSINALRAVTGSLASPPDANGMINSWTAAAATIGAGSIGTVSSGGVPIMIGNWARGGTVIIGNNNPGNASGGGTLEAGSVASSASGIVPGSFSLVTDGVGTLSVLDCGSAGAGTANTFMVYFTDGLSNSKRLVLQTGGGDDFLKFTMPRTAAVGVLVTAYR